MKRLFETKSVRTIMVLFFFTGTILFISSCMMMAPMHHMDYDEHHHEGTHEQVYTDPVCGHSIDQISGELTYEYRGIPYYFHSNECMESFKQSPRKYLQHNPSNDYGHQNQYWLWGMGGVAMGAMMVFMFL